MRPDAAAPPREEPDTAMVLAAGLGTRLRPLTDRLSKCMVPIGGRPVLEHTIVHLATYGVRRIVINLSRFPDAVMRYFGDGSRWGVRIAYSLEEQPLGTAGALRKVSALLTRPFLVWYGDNLSTCALDRLTAFHRARDALATIALYWRDDPTPSGIVGCDASGRVRRFMEKPRPDEVFSHWVSAGIFVVEPALLDLIPADGRPDFGRDVFPALLAQGQPLYGYRMAPDEGLWWIDTPDDLERVRTEHPETQTAGARIAAKGSEA